MESLFTELDQTFQFFLRDTLTANTAGNQTTLSNMIQGGAMIQAAKTENGSRFLDLTNQMETLLYGRMLPIAWRVSGNEQ